MEAIGRRDRTRRRARDRAMTTANELKDVGNGHFKNGAYDDAVAAFTRAIELDATNHVLHSNRSAAHAGAERWSDALRDAERTICLLYTSPSPRDATLSRMPSSA